MPSSVPKQSKELPDLPEIRGSHQDACDALMRSEKLASLGRMASIIVHEINNPLAAAMNLLFLAQNDPNCPLSVRQDLSKAESELRRITQIMRQMLDFYRDSAGSGPVSLAAVLEETLGLFETRIMAKGVKLQKRCSGKALVMSTAADLRQILSNLIFNSLDAVAEGGSIQLRVAECSANGRPVARITVADNGTGIAASARPRIFEPLFTTKQSVGTGLGLWVTAQLVERLGGAIRFRSSTRQERRGTTFVIELPAVLVDSAS